MSFHTTHVRETPRSARTPLWTAGLALASTLLLAGWGGCSGETAPATGVVSAATGTGAASAAPVAGPVAPAGSCDAALSGPTEKREADGYVLEVAPAKDAAVGAVAASCVRLTPKEGYKVNVAFPFKVAVKAPDGVDARTSVGKADAEKFDEHQAAVPMAFVASSAGDKAFSAEVRFSVCTETVCETPVEELAWTVTTH